MTDHVHVWSATFADAVMTCACGATQPIETPEDITLTTPTGRVTVNPPPGQRKVTGL